MPEGPSGSKKTHDKTGDQAATACGVGWPTAEADIAAWTDVYFKRTRKAVERFGDIRVTYAVFMRRSEEHTSELQSLMRISYAVFCLKKKKTLLTQYTLNHYTSQTLTTSINTQKTPH